MGWSWAGAAEYLEEREAKKERLEERAQARRDKLTLSVAPLLAERIKAQNSAAAERSQLGGYFSRRLSGEGVSESERKAYVNLATRNPSVGKAIMGSLQTFEEKNGRRLSAPEIIKFADILDQTKPENVSYEDWVDQASKMIVEGKSGIDFEATADKLIGGELSLEELQRKQMELLIPEATIGGSAFTPDINMAAVVGTDPARQAALRKNVTEEAKIRSSSDLARMDEEIKTYLEQGRAIPKDLEGRYNGLKRALVQDDKEAALFDYYAGTLIPEMAKRNPEYEYIWPQYFQKAPKKVTYEVIPAGTN